MIKGQCFACKKELSFSNPPGFREECVHCSADVHACKNCLHYDEKAYNECREPQADRLLEKERANYCEHFSLRGSLTSSQGLSEKDKLRAAAEALFKKNN